MIYLYFRQWYENTLTNLCEQKEHPREKFWSSSFAVGSSDWFEKMSILPEPIKSKYLKPLDNKGKRASFIINPPQSALLDLWKRIKNKK